jgi:hypothetical protein
MQQKRALSACGINLPRSASCFSGQIFTLSGLLAKTHFAIIESPTCTSLAQSTITCLATLLFIRRQMKYERERRFYSGPLFCSTPTWLIGPNVYVRISFSQRAQNREFLLPLHAAAYIYRALQKGRGGWPCQSVAAHLHGGISYGTES